MEFKNLKVKSLKAWKGIAFFLYLLVVSISLMAQNPPTEVLVVSGKVKTERTFTLADIRKFKSISLENINTSCSPKKKEQAKLVKAVLVKDLLDSVKYQYSSPKMLNRFYFRFEGSDGYTVVFSFNEIYNTETGNHLFLVTEMDGQPMEKMENRILLLTTADLKSGTRNIKGLARIAVCEAE